MRTVPHGSRRLVGLGLAGVWLLAGCGSSKTAAPTTTAAPANIAGEAIGTANVAGVGTILTNGDGFTVYILTSEQGGKLTCTAKNGCTDTWPDIELPSGIPVATAENGSQASLLGTVKNSSGAVIVTYDGRPLHTYSGDTGPDQAHGQGVASFGGTWETITPAGTPVAAAAGSSTT